MTIAQQTVFRCPSDKVQKSLIVEDVDYALRFKKFEDSYRTHFTNQLRSGPTERNNPPIYRLPVVVHVIHDCAEYGTKANPTDEEIKSIIQESSNRFRHNSGLNFGNPFSGIDTEIELCLASVDPSGKYTTGIVRYQDPINASLPNDPNLDGEYINLVDPLKLISWPIDNYYNIYIVTNLADASGVFIGSIDGTIYDSEAFWSGLISHETGHYLSLAHTFDGGCVNGDCLIDNDKVCDTPPKEQPGTNNNSCGMPGNSCSTDEDDTSTNNPYRAISLGGNGDKPDLLENYMDYTGGCWEAFSAGQAFRMRTFIEANRMSLITNGTNCDQVVTNNLDIGIVGIFDNYRTCDIMYTSQVDVKNFGSNQINNLTIIIDVNGVEVVSKTFTAFINPGETITFDLDPISIPLGRSILEFKTSSPNSSQDNFTNNDSQCIYRLHQSKGSEIPFMEDFNSCNFQENIQLLSSSNTQWFVSQSDSLATCNNCFAAITGGAPNNEQASFTLPLLDLTNASNPMLSFDLGYIPRYDFIINELNIEIGSDCGTPSSFFNESGINLATNDPPVFSNGTFMIPTCDQFNTIEIDLTSFAGQDNVSITFNGFGRWFSPLLIDNINIIENTSTCNPDPDGVIKVININNNGPGSLREAIDCANNSPGANLIVFAVPGNDLTIILDSALPATTDNAGLIINGSTQSSGLINIDCSQLDISNGLVVLSILSDNTAILGLEFSGLGGILTSGAVCTFIEAGSQIDPVENIKIGAAENGNLFNNMSGGDPLASENLSAIRITNTIGIEVIGNAIGLARDLLGVSNSCDYCVGIISSSLNRGLVSIGKSDDRANIIGGWTKAVVLEGTDATYELFGNIIGTDPSQSLDFGNTEVGIEILGGNCQIGGSLLSQRNVLGFNGDGIVIKGVNTSIENNQFFNNQNSGIDIRFFGADPLINDNHLVANNKIIQNTFGISINNSISNILITGNEIDENDLEGIRSYNDLNNPPVQGQHYTVNSISCNGVGITNAAEGLVSPIEPVIESATFTQVEGSSISNGELEVYLHLECPGSACQGFQYLGTTTADASGFWSFVFPSKLPATAQITATVTNENNSTSEFADCYRLCAISAFDLGRDSSVCVGAEVTLNIGTPGSIIEWSTGSPDSMITVTMPGVYSVTVSDGTASCSEADTIEIVYENLVAVASSSTSAIGCNPDTITLSSALSSVALEEYISWSTIDGNIIDNKDMVNILVDRPGSYVLTLSHPSLMCSATDTLIITSSSILPSLEIFGSDDSYQIGCGVTSITLTGVTDVIADPEFLWSDAANKILSTTDSLIVALPGTYSIIVKDPISGCSAFKEFMVSKDSTNSSDQIDLGPEEMVTLGDSIQISILTNLSTDQISSINWNVFSECPDCPSIVFVPDQDILVQVVVMDINGCVLQAEKWIRVVAPESNYFAPNVFTPNGDQLNDYFNIFTQPTINLIKSLSIFDRLGSLVWTAEGILPNQQNVGWDGTHKGVLVNPGVFIYKAVLVDLNGKEQIISGDITVVQ